MNETADAAHPFKLATSPSRGFLNSSFNETPTSRAREGRPQAKMHPDDLARLGLADGASIRDGQRARRDQRCARKAFDGVQRGVVIVEGMQPNDMLPRAARASTR